MILPGDRVAPTNRYMVESGETRKRWSEDETILALYLYFQLPFGKLDQRNREVRALAIALGRTSSSVAMKLVNFASLDPKITESGRKGLSGASRLDRAMYAQFGLDWDSLVTRAQSLWARQVEPNISASPDEDQPVDAWFEPYEGPTTTESLVTLRRGQDFFRRAVRANYLDVCCITGIADPRLLVASHIKPWGVDKENRHNPANGLLLSGTLDRAFDCGLITVNRNLCVMVSKQLQASKSRETTAYFRQFENLRLRSAKRFDPDPVFLDWHIANRFVDNRSP